MDTALGRFPFVSRLDIVRVYKPGTAPSESTFRTLRSHRYVSRGTNIRLQRNSRVSGQLRCYAALDLDAAVLARQGHFEAAIELANEANKFETEWSPILAELAYELDIADFDNLFALRNRLVHGLGPASAQLERLRGNFAALLETALHEQFVRVIEIADQWATLDVLTPAVTAQFAVDSVLPQSAGLGVNDLGLLRVEHSQGVSFVSLIAALAETIEDADLDPALLAYFSEEPLPPAVRADNEVRRSGQDTVVVPPGIVALAS